MRSSNIELLRIVSMLLIILFHFSVHGSWPEAGPIASDIAVEMLSFGGKLGVNCFVLITGYFMAHSHLKAQSLLRVVLQTWFYSFAILAIFAVAQPDLITPERLRKAVVPIVSGEYWFVTCYLALMVVSPFLNVLYHHLSNDGRSRLMAVAFVVVSLLPTLTTFNPVGNDLVWFFYLYLLGGWVRERREGRDAAFCKLDPLRFVEQWGAARTAIASVGVVWASMALVAGAHRAWGFDYIQPDYLIWQYMVPTFLASLALLVLFQNLKMSVTASVNAVAKTTLGIYLIHDNPIVRAWLWPHFAGIYDGGWAAILAFGIGSALVVFACGAAIDQARIVLLERPLFRWINRRGAAVLEKADGWLASIGKPPVRES